MDYTTNTAEKSLFYLYLSNIAITESYSPPDCELCLMRWRAPAMRRLSHFCYFADTYEYVFRRCHASARQLRHFCLITRYIFYRKTQRRFLSRLIRSWLQSAAHPIPFLCYQSNGRKVRLYSWLHARRRASAFPSRNYKREIPSRRLPVWAYRWKSEHKHLRLINLFTYVYVCHRHEQSFKRGDVICKFDRYRPGERRTRTSIQLNETEHCELNTDLVFGTPASLFYVIAHSPYHSEPLVWSQYRIRHILRGPYRLEGSGFEGYRCRRYNNVFLPDHGVGCMGWWIWMCLWNHGEYFMFWVKQLLDLIIGIPWGLHWILRRCCETFAG